MLKSCDHLCVTEQQEKTKDCGHFSIDL